MVQRASIKHVAAAAGVSIKTVSRVVNGVSTVDPGMRTRVEDAIRELNYVPNTVARSLKTGAGNTIGVLVDSISDVFFASVVSAVEELALARGLGVVIGSTGHDVDREREQLLRLAGQNVRGVVLAPVADRQEVLVPYRSSMPVVAIDRRLEGYDSVTVDDYAGARTAVQTLVDGGHRRIALLGWDPGFTTSERRRAAYEDVLAENGLPVPAGFVPLVPMDGDAAAQALTGVLALPEPPTAVFLSNARHAAGVVAATHALGRLDLALVSFGDFLLADSVEPSITCIDQDPYEIGTRAVERLLELLEDPDADPVETVVPTGFVTRTSHLLPPARQVPQNTPAHRRPGDAP